MQTYGTAPYRVVEYAIANGVHYLDLADGKEFVMGVSHYSVQAVAADIAVISGLSTYPALTSAVLMHWQSEHKAVTALRAAIAPSPQSNLGRSVIDSIASYAGNPIGGGRNALCSGFKSRICPPGYTPLERILFADVDVPDATLLPAVFPGLRDVRNAAGTKPQFMLWALMGLSHLVKWQLLSNLRLLSPLVHVVQKHLNVGQHRSGIVVEATAINHDNEQINCSWHLIAERDDGPQIPVIPAAIVIRKALRGHYPTSGARAATGEVTLADYQREFDSLAIVCGFHNESSNRSVYERVLGNAFNTLPAPITTLHRPEPEVCYTGEAVVERGRNPLANLVCAIFRFPKASRSTPVTVHIAVEDETETWTRCFGGHTMVSTQEAGTGRYDRLLVERFGPFAIGIALLVEHDQLVNLPQTWSVLGLPLPRMLLPRGQMYESAIDDQFRFHVEIRAPLFGLLVKYTGWLKPVS